MVGAGGPGYQEALEFRVLTEHVEDGLAEGALRQDAFGHAIEPGLELLNDRRGLRSPDRQAIGERRASWRCSTTR